MNGCRLCQTLIQFMQGGDGSDATKIRGIEEGENIVVDAILAEVCEQRGLQPDEDVFYRGLSDFIADFEALAQAADMVVIPAQDIFSAVFKGELEVCGRCSLKERVAAFSPSSSDVVEDTAAIMVGRDDYRL